MKSLQKNLGYALTVFLCALLIFNPQKSMMYARKGLLLCSEIIIPSLFPFFVCSGLLVYSGFCEKMAHFAAPVMKPLFNINPTGAAAFVLGIVSGYPQGAVTAGQLYGGGYLSKSEAERLLAFCNNSGPLFILGTVGTAMYKNPKIGILLYVSHILGAVTVGIIFRFYKKESYNAPVSSINTERKNISQIFSSSITDSLRSILNVCATVVFCSVISKLLLDMFRLDGIPGAAAASVLEFVSGLGKISNLDISECKKLVMSAGVCAFAGLSVHLQVMGTVSDKNLSLKPYFAGKALHAVFACLYTVIAIKIFPVTETVFSAATRDEKMCVGFFMGSSCVMTAVLSGVVIFGLYCIFKFTGNRLTTKTMNKIRGFFL